MTEEKRIVQEELLETCLLLKGEYDYLSFITAVDYPDRNALDLVYHLRSSDCRKNLYLKSEVPRQNAEVHSVAVIWPAAEWHEREVFDLFGVKFIGNPDLRRILLPEDWVGHPLLKDYVHPGTVKRPETIK